jgi:hypothetical protein
MTVVPATEQMSQRVDRLLRSLVGVADLRPSWDRHGRLHQVHILQDGDIQQHQLTRNVVSALKAGFGIQLDLLGVCVYAEEPLFAAAVEHIQPRAGHRTPAGPHPDAASAAPPVPEAGIHANGTANGAAAIEPGAVANEPHVPLNSPVLPAAAVPPVTPEPPAAAGQAVAAPVPEPASAPYPGIVRNTQGVPASPPKTVNGNGGVHRANGAGYVAGLERGVAKVAHLQEPVRAPDSTVGSMTLERLDVERNGATLRCHIVLALGARRYSAIAEVPDGPAVEADLAATVTLDALRAGALTSARLEGVGFTTIGETTYIVAGIRAASSGAKRASAAPLIGSMARSAALAVLGAVGPITADRQQAAEREFGKL